MRFFSFSLLIGGGALLGHLYLYRRLVRKLIADERRRRAAGLFLAVMALLLLLRGPIRRLGPGVDLVYTQLAYSWIALALSLVIAVAIGDLVLLLTALVARGDASTRAAAVTERSALASPPTREGDAVGEVDDAPEPVAAEEADDEAQRPTPPPRGEGLDRGRAPEASASLGRRKLLEALPWAVVAGGAGIATYGGYRALTAPEVSEVVVPIPRLPAALEGLTIAQLTDVHVGAFIGPRFLDLLVAAVNAERPDVIAITGDLVDGDVRTLGPAVATLGKLKARYGTYFVTGNHEYYAGERPWVEFLDRLGMTVLRNARVGIGDGGGRFDLVGVDDWTGGRRRGGSVYDLDAALDRRDPDRAAVLLAHQPTNFEVAAARGIDLQISGHTHGGQIFPMTEIVRFRYPYHRGLYRVGESHLYVSRGCGFWGPPSRLGSPPEIAKYVLVRA